MYSTALRDWQVRSCAISYEPHAVTRRRYVISSTTAVATHLSRSRVAVSPPPASGSSRLTAPTRASARFTTPRHRHVARRHVKRFSLPVNYRQTRYHFSFLFFAFSAPGKLLCQRGSDQMCYTSFRNPYVTADEKQRCE